MANSRQDTKPVLSGILKLFSGTFLSKIFGFFRTLVTAHYVGTSVFNDIFVAAYRLPNLFRRILGEKALESAFMPVFKGFLSKGKTAEASLLATRVFVKILIALFVLAGLGIVFSKALVFLVAGGFFQNPNQLLPNGEPIVTAAVKMTRIMMPAMVFTGIFSFFGAILLARGRFTSYSLNPAASSAVVIISIFLLWDTFGFYALGFSVLAGGAVHAFLNFFFARVPKSLAPPNTGEAVQGEKKVFRMVPPIFGDAAVERVSTIVDTQMASLLAVGSISALDYGRLLYLLPFGLLSLSVNRSVMPFLTEKNALNDSRGFL